MKLVKQFLVLGASLLCAIVFCSTAGAAPPNKAPRVVLFASPSNQQGNVPLSRIQLKSPTKTLALRDGSILICDPCTYRVLKIAPNGTVSVFVGSGQSGERINTRNPRVTQLTSPTSALELPDETVLICDTSADRLIVVSPKGDSLQEVLSPELLRPSGLAFNPRDDSIIVTSLWKSRVHRLIGPPWSKIEMVPLAQTKGQDQQSANNATGPIFALPTAPLLRPDGSLLIANKFSHTVVAISLTDDISVFGICDNTVLYNPQGISESQVSDADDAILVADSGHNRIVRATADGNIKVVVGSPNSEAGDDFNPDDPLKTQLKYPRDVRLLPDGSSLVSDTGNGRLILVAPQDELQQQLDRLFSEAKKMIENNLVSKFAAVAGEINTLTWSVEQRLSALDKASASHARQRTASKQWLPSVSTLPDHFVDA